MPPLKIRVAAAVLAVALGARADGIVQTAHNLSVSGPGPVKATSETQVCVFCHTPHDANPEGPLWNHQLSSGVTYLKYTSPTMVAYTSQATAPDPNGASKLCLSCHDGTVALGAVSSQPIPIPLQGGKLRLVPGDPGYIGTDLSKTHPISFVVTDQLVATNNSVNASGLQLNSVAAMSVDPAVRLDGQGRVQCTSCHDPHTDANFATSGVHFYAKPGRSDPCLVCHVSGPADMGPHATTTAPSTTRVAMSAAAPLALKQLATALPTGGGSALAAPAGVSVQPLPGSATPTAHADPATLPKRCMSCHVSHADEEGRRALLLGRDESACYRCHGPGGDSEVQAGRLSPVARPVNVQTEFQKPSHHPIEFPGDHKPDERVPESNPNARRHVLCIDCHDPHATRTRPASQRGRANPSPTRRFSTEAQLCLLCHGPAANLPANQHDVSRQLSATSFHPVLAPGRATSVPSLLPPLTTASTINCTDCHGNESASGPAGPHGSLYAPLLARNYDRTDAIPESPARYDLCYGCHDRSSILGDASFPYHRKHVVEQRTPCAACHSAHGAEQPHLVELDPNLVQPNAKGVRAYVAQGAGAGQCSLSCHGANHDATAYCAPGVPCSQGARALRSAEMPSPVPAADSLFPGWPGR